MDASVNMMNIGPQKPVVANAKTGQAKNLNSDRQPQAFSDVMAGVSNDHQEIADNIDMAVTTDNSSTANPLAAMAVPMVIMPIQSSADLNQNSKSEVSKAGSINIDMNLIQTAQESGVDMAQPIDTTAELNVSAQPAVHSAQELTALLSNNSQVDAVGMTENETNIQKETRYNSVSNNFTLGNSNRESMPVTSITIQTIPPANIEAMSNETIQAIPEVATGDIPDESAVARQVVSDEKNITLQVASANVKPELATTSLPQANQQIGESPNNELIQATNTGEQVSINAANDKNTSGDSNKNSDLLGNSKETVSIEASTVIKDSGTNQSVFASMLEHRAMPVNNHVVQETKQLTEQPIHDPYNINSQIVEQAHLIKGSNNSQMVIKLKPEHLGELTLKVAVDNGVVSASFHSDNQEVRGIIESSLTQLKQEMSNQGLKVDHVGVYAGLGQFLSNGQQRETARQPMLKFQNKKAEQQAFQDGEAVTELSEVTDAGVDYRV